MAEIENQVSQPIYFDWEEFEKRMRQILKPWEGFDLVGPGRRPYRFLTKRLVVPLSTINVGTLQVGQEATIGTAYLPPGEELRLERVPEMGLEAYLYLTGGAVVIRNDDLTMTAQVGNCFFLRDPNGNSVVFSAIDLSIGPNGGMAITWQGQSEIFLGPYNVANPPYLFTVNVRTAKILGFNNLYGEMYINYSFVYLVRK